MEDNVIAALWLVVEIKQLQPDYTASKSVMLWQRWVLEFPIPIPIQTALQSSIQITVFKFWVSHTTNEENNKGKGRDNVRKLVNNRANRIDMHSGTDKCLKKMVNEHIVYFKHSLSTRIRTASVEENFPFSPSWLTFTFEPL